VGEGVQVRVYDPTLLAKPELKDYVVDTAKANGINIQLAVRKAGGTDGRELQVANRGIPTIVLGVPVRYAHSHNGLISMDDFDALVELVVKLSENLNATALETILK